MKAILQYRARNNLTQEAMALLVGTTKATICRLENGTRTASPSLAMKIEKVTGISRRLLRPDLFGKAA